MVGITMLMCYVAASGEQLIVTLKNVNAPSAMSFVAKGQPVFPATVLGAARVRASTPEALQAVDRLARHFVLDVRDVDLDRVVEELRQNPDVEYVSRPARYSIHGLTNDSLSDEQFALSAVRAAEAWKLATGRGIVVGVLDTGIDWDHEDLRDALAVNADEDANGNGRFEPWPVTETRDGRTGDLNGIDDDGNGYIDDVIGFDFVDQTLRNIGDDRDRDPIPFDEQGHGTSVAGVIAATANNARGIAGLAYDARVITLRAFDATGNAEEDDIAAALVYAALNNIHIVNMSFGDGIDAPVLRDAIRFAASRNCVLIASAGNTGQVSRQYPAGYDDVIAVGATNRRDERAPFSSTGALVTLVAPGDAIVTTSVDSRYRTVSGTSFAAPYVAATVAMMLERGTLTPDEVRGVLQVTSKDLGIRGHDAEFGAGRLDAAAAVTTSLPSVVMIEALENESEVDIQQIPQLIVRGTVLTPTFQRRALYVGRGIEPSQWTLVSEGDQIQSGVLGSIDLTPYADEDVTVRLVVTLQNGRTIEHRKRLRVVGGGSLQVVELQIQNAWHDDRSRPVVTVVTDRKTSCRIDVTDEIGRVTTYGDRFRFSRNHCVSISDAMPDTDLTVRSVLTADNGDSVVRMETFRTSSNAAAVSGFTDVSEPQLVPYVMPTIVQFTASSEPSIVYNDLSSSSFGRMKVATLREDVWTNVDSTTSWIPRAAGDSDGNGILEIFAHVVGRAALFTSAAPGGRPFERITFADTVTGRWNAAGMGDITGDGKPELLMIGDSGCLAVTYRNGQYERLGIAPHASAPIPGNSTNRVDEVSVGVGDIDGDGRNEITFADTDGDLNVYTWTGSGFELHTVVERNGSGGSGYVAVADITGDGIDDIIYGVPDSTTLSSQREYGRQLWTYRLISRHNRPTVGVIDSVMIDGVRYGIGYRNGLGVGQLDARSGSEVVICATPRMWVFTWNDASQSLAPIYYRTGVASPRFVVYDGNGDGINELGLGTTVDGLGFMTGFLFIQADTAALYRRIPQGLRARLREADTVDVSWTPLQGALGYVVQRSTTEDPIFRSRDTVDVHRFTEVVPQYTVVRYRVSALVSGGEGGRSSAVAVTTGAPAQLLSCTPTTFDSTALARGLTIVAEYSKRLAGRDLATSIAVLYRGSDVIGRSTSVVLATDTSITIGFPGIDVSPGPLEMVVLGVRDAQDIPAVQATQSLTVTSTPVVDSLILRRVEVLSPTQVRLWYSDNVDQSAAATVTNYVLQPRGQIVSVDSDGSDSVTVQFSPDEPLRPIGLTYSIRVTNVVSRQGSPIVKSPLGSTLAFLLAAENADNVFVYPHPIVLSRDADVVFAGIPNNANIDVLDQRFEKLISLLERDGTGGVPWDIRDASGRRLPPGLYFYRVNDGELHKFIIKR